MTESDFLFFSELFPSDWFKKIEVSELLQDYKSIELDLGAGDGSFLINMAKKFPSHKFLAIERLLGRVRKISKKLKNENLNNVNLLRIDSNYAVKWILPHNIFSRIHFLFPDPWPKKKHENKRQMSQEEFVKSIYKLLKNNGELLFMTDSENYFKEVIQKHDQLNFFKIGKWDEGDFFYPQTDFEKLWISQGRGIHRLRLIKSV